MCCSPPSEEMGGSIALFAFPLPPAGQQGGAPVQAQRVLSKVGLTARIASLPSAHPLVTPPFPSGNDSHTMLCTSYKVKP